MIFNKSTYHPPQKKKKLKTCYVPVQFIKWHSLLKNILYVYILILLKMLYIITF